MSAEKRCVNCGQVIVPDDGDGWLHKIGWRRACAPTFAEPREEYT